MNVLFFYTLVTNSVLAVIRELAHRKGCNIFIFYEDNKGNKPYTIESIRNVEFLPLSKFNSRQILNFVDKVSPRLIYVTAWQETKYLLACMKARKNNIPVVSGFDDNWTGTFRQKMGSLIMSFIRPLFFSHAMVSGPRQYYYALKFGFPEVRILYYLFSADIEKFKILNTVDVESNYNDGDKYFIYIGRYSEVKGISTLIKGFEYYRNNLSGKYRLYCYGNGNLKSQLEKTNYVSVFDYSDFNEIKKMAKNSVAFVLPSNYDPSPLVVHEMCTIGVPLILSTAVGNRLMFLINGFNGFSFVNNDFYDLSKQLKKLELLSEIERKSFGVNSRKLASQHSPEFVAASLLSVID